MDNELLPELIRDIVELVGSYEPAIALVNAYGGLRIKVPAGARDNSLMRGRLVTIMGAEAAEKFIATYAKNDLAIPRCAEALRAARNRIIISDYDSGRRSVPQLAMDHTLTTRQIYAILTRVPGEVPEGLGQRQVDDKQMALF